MRRSIGLIAAFMSLSVVGDLKVVAGKYDVRLHTLSG